MARKRYKKKRIDYRNGGRVSLKHGGRPQRGNFDNADEYRNALDNWASDPAHSVGQTSPQRTTPERMAEISSMPGVPSPTGIKSVDEYNVGLSIPPEDNNLVATPTRTRTTIERGQDKKVTGGSSNTPYIPPAVTDPKDKDTRNIYTEATEGKITEARTTAESTRRGETPLPTIPDPQQVRENITTSDTEIQQIADTGQATAATSTTALKDTATVGTATTSAQQAPMSVSTMTAAQNTTPSAVDGATGQLSADATAQVTEIRNLSGEAVAAQVSDSLVNAAVIVETDIGAC